MFDRAVSTAVKGATLGVLAILFSGPVQAKEMRQHGAFATVEEQTSNGIDCSLIVDYPANGKSFGLSMSKRATKMFITFYITSIDELRGREASLQIDHHEVLRFEQSRTNTAGSIFGVHVEVDDKRVQQELAEDVRNAHDIEVVAGDYRLPIPIEGLKQAVDEYLGCRSERSL